MSPKHFQTSPCGENIHYWFKYSIFKIFIFIINMKLWQVFSRKPLNDCLCKNGLRHRGFLSDFCRIITFWNSYFPERCWAVSYDVIKISKTSILKLILWKTCFLCTQRSSVAKNTQTPAKHAVSDSDSAEVCQW